MPRGGGARGGGGGGGGGGRGGGRGKKGTHKGGHRHFTNEAELAVQAEKAQKAKEWRKMKGIASDDEEEGEGKEEGAASAEPKTEGEDDGIEIEGSDSETESDEEEEKAKGVSHLIEVANPNRTGARQIKKVSELEEDATTQLSRREREEIQKQQAKAHYQKLHMEGKTEEARSDMARLALIRKQRDDASRKRDEEKKQKDAVSAAAGQRLKDKKAQTGH